MRSCHTWKGPGAREREPPEPSPASMFGQARGRPPAPSLRCVRSYRSARSIAKCTASTHRSPSKLRKGGPRSDEQISVVPLTGWRQSVMGVGVAVDVSLVHRNDAWGGVSCSLVVDSWHGQPSTQCYCSSPQATTPAALAFMPEGDTVTSVEE